MKTNNPTDEQIKKYKRHGSGLIDGEKYVDAYGGIMISGHQNHVSLKKNRVHNAWCD